MTRVVVTDGDERAALATVRSLGHAGYETIVCSPSGRSIAGASRQATREEAVPDPLENPADFAARIATIVRDSGAKVVLPISEASLLAILPARDQLGDAVVPFPSLGQVRKILDKAAVFEAARTVGILVPAQHTLDSPGAIDATLASVSRYPVVIKPARSVTESDGTRIKTHVSHADSKDALELLLRTTDASWYPLLIQDRVIGPGTGVFVLLWDGRVVASFGHRRLREKPPSGGVSVLRESVAVEPDLLERSIRLLQRFDWNGVAMVELKRDAGTGDPYLMEINGRLWGSLQLAIDAGVDFPRLLVECALGGNPAPVTSYRPGVRSRWFLGDVDHLLLRLRRSKAALDLDHSAAGRARAVWDFIRAMGPADRGEVFRWDDPGPGVREAARWLKDLGG